MTRPLVTKAYAAMQPRAHSTPAGGFEHADRRSPVFRERARRLSPGAACLLTAATMQACGGGAVSAEAYPPPPPEPVELTVAEPTAPVDPGVGEPLVLVPAEGSVAGGSAAAPWPERPARNRQLQTPRPSVFQLGVKLTKRWSTRVGTTTFRTTMAMVGPSIVIGTHGRTLAGANEREDGVYLLEAATGKVQSVLRAPGKGDLDVGGVAVDGDRVFYGTDNGYVVADTLGGARLWSAQLQGKVRAAPAVGDLDGNGRPDVVVGDESGALVAFDAATGQRLWTVVTGANDYGNRGFIAAAAIADLDGDGRDDVVAGARDGILAAYRGADGRVLWQAQHGSGIHASPSIVDFDGDGQLEVLGAWAYSEVAVLDGRTGAELWGQAVEQDGAGIEGIFGSPTPLPGSPGVIVVPTAWWGDEDGVVAVGPMERAFKSFEGRVTATAVVTDLDGDGVLEAIIGTERGKLVALHADGGRAELTSLAGGIEAAALLADTNGDGTEELLVASRDGMLTCFETGSRAKPALRRFRGNDPRNRGELGVVALGWRNATGASRPTSGAATNQGTVRIDYLRCCSDLQTEATRAPSPLNRLLLETSAVCTRLAAAGADRVKAMGEVARSLGGRVPVPGACR